MDFSAPGRGRREVSRVTTRPVATVALMSLVLIALLVAAWKYTEAQNDRADTVNWVRGIDRAGACEYSVELEGGSSALVTSWCGNPDYDDPFSRLHRVLTSEETEALLAGYEEYR